MEVDMQEYVCKTGLQISNAGHKVYRCYRDKRDKDRLWVVAHNVVNPADHIYTGYPYDTKSEGFAGRWLVFNLADHDKSISLQGPWHSNAGALLEHTGVDIRDKHYCQVVIGTDFKPSPSSMSVITGILHYEEPCVQAYDRYKDLLYDIMSKHPGIDRLVYNHAGSGGATTGSYLRTRDYERDISERKGRGS